MNPQVIAFLVAEAIKLLLSHLAQSGQLNTLTQPQAEAMVKQLADALPLVLPTPEQLESGTGPITQ